VLIQTEFLVNSLDGRPFTTQRGKATDFCNARKPSQSSEIHSQPMFASELLAQSEIAAKRTWPRWQRFIYRVARLIDRDGCHDRLPCSQINTTRLCTTAFSAKVGTSPAHLLCRNHRRHPRFFSLLMILVLKQPCPFGSHNRDDASELVRRFLSWLATSRRQRNQVGSIRGTLLPPRCTGREGA